MEFNFGDNSLKSGIYKLVNKINGKLYIGSTKEFKSNWAQQVRSLRNGKHANRQIQADFNKCGETSFVFEIIEIVEDTEEVRFAKEIECIKEFFDHEANCYNVDLQPNLITDDDEGIQKKNEWSGKTANQKIASDKQISRPRLRRSRAG